jgi:hypothetical protein
MKANWRVTGLSTGAVLTVLACALAVAQYKEVLGERDRVRMLEKSLADYRARGDGYRRTAAEVEGLRAEYKRFCDRVPFQPDIGQMLEEVGRDVVGSTAAEREILTKPTVPGFPLNRAPVLLKFKGSAEQAFALIRKIEGDGRLTRIDRVLLEQAAPGTDKPLTVLVEFSVFSRASEEALTWSSEE